MPTSRTLLILGLVIFGLGVAVFYLGATGDITAVSSDAGTAPVRRTGQIAIAMAFAGIVVVIVGAVRRARGR